MKQILFSLLTIIATVAVVTNATQSVFSSQTTVTSNTVASGTLELRVNGEPTIAGFTFNNVAPGDCQEGNYTLQNYGAPWYGGPSNLAIKELVANITNISGDTDLSDALTIELGADRGWGTWMPVYSTGSLSGLTDADLLTPRWSDLAPGNSEIIHYKVCLPDTGVDQNELQGKTTSFDFEFQAFNPHR